MSGTITDAVGGTRIKRLTWQTRFRSDPASPKGCPSLHALQRDEAIHFPPKAEQVFLQTRRVRKPFPGGLFAMDGTLCRCTEKGRRNDFFCRKGYPCINVQLDNRNRTITFETPWNGLNARNRECRFDQTADMIQFVNTLGVPREQVCHAEKPVKEGLYPDHPYVSSALGQHILSPVPDLRRSWFAQVPRGDTVARSQHGADAVQGRAGRSHLQQADEGPVHEVDGKTDP